MTPRLMWKVGEFAESIGVSRSKAYELIAAGEVPSVKIGGVVRIPVGMAHAWAEELARAQNGKTVPATVISS